MKNWKIVSTFNPSENIVSQIIKSRGIKDLEGFFNPSNLTDAFDKYFSLEFKKSLKTAKEIVFEQIAKNGKIIIFGDYDSDGISASAVLFNTLTKELGYTNLACFIPNRFEHGYGLSFSALGDLFNVVKDKDILFITVDTGITAEKEVSHLKANGHKVIILDHHQKPDILPNADAIVWSDEVVAATLSWVFSKVLGSKSLTNIAYAALATVTDIQPVLAFNRVVVKTGLNVINTNPPEGLKKLLEVSGKSVGEIGTYELGWLIGPRLNASGRIVSADDALKLLTSDDIQEILTLAQKLNQVNAQRQDKTIEMYDIASAVKSETLPKIIISENENYHEGIIGLVAAKLVQQYYRPSIVIAKTDMTGKGSARSVKGFDITAFLRKFEHLFLSLGGHPMAAGFSIDVDKIQEFTHLALQEAEKEITDEMLIPEITVDLAIPLSALDITVLEQLDKLKPFGIGNEEPMFVSRDVGIADVSQMGKDGKHARFKFYCDNKYYRGVMFGGWDTVSKLKLGDKIDIAYNVKKNEYNGIVNLDLVIKDLKQLQ